MQIREEFFVMTSVPSESEMYGTSIIIEIHAAIQYVKSRAHDVHYVQENNILYTMREKIYLSLKRTIFR
jgi:hypothetical protein